MTELSNNLDAGPAGTTITTANSSNGQNDPFDAVTLTGTGTAVYRAAVARPSAEFVAEFDSGNSAGAAYCAWSTAMGAQTHFWVRLYLRLTVTPPSTYQSPYLVVGNGTTPMASFEASDISPGNLQIRSHLGSLGVNVFNAYTVTVGDWVRFESEFTMFDPGGPSEEFTMTGRLYTDDLVDSDAAIDTQGFGEFSNASPGPFGNFSFTQFGLPVSHSRYEPSQLSGLALSTVDWIGPAPRWHKGVPGIQPNFIAPHVDSW